MYFVLNPCNFGVYTSNIGFVRMSPRMLFFILSRFRVTSHQDSGHSFLSKFLVTAVPWSMFSGNSNILPAVLEEIATCFCKLFDHGVELGNEKFYFAVIGVNFMLIVVTLPGHTKQSEKCRTFQCVHTAMPLQATLGMLATTRAGWTVLPAHKS